MPVLPIDITAIVAVIMGKPFVQSMGHFFQSRTAEETVRLLERRMPLLEQHMETMDTAVQRLSDAADFHSELRSGQHSRLPSQ